VGLGVGVAVGTGVGVPVGIGVGVAVGVAVGTGVGVGVCVGATVGLIVGKHVGHVVSGLAGFTRPDERVETVLPCENVPARDCARPATGCKRDAASARPSASARRLASARRSSSERGNFGKYASGLVTVTDSASRTFTPYRTHPVTIRARNEAADGIGIIALGVTRVRWLDGIRSCGCAGA